MNHEKTCPGLPPHAKYIQGVGELHQRKPWNGEGKDDAASEAPG